MESQTLRTPNIREETAQFPQIIIIQRGSHGNTGVVEYK